MTYDPNFKENFSKEVRGVVEQRFSHYYNVMADSEIEELKLSRRKIIIDGKEYTFSIGRRFTKVDGVGARPNARIGNTIDYSRDVYEVTPQHIAAFIRELNHG